MIQQGCAVTGHSCPCPYGKTGATYSWFSSPASLVVGLLRALLLCNLSLLPLLPLLHESLLTLCLGIPELTLSFFPLPSYPGPWLHQPEIFPLIPTFDPIMDPKSCQAEQHPCWWWWMEQNQQDVNPWIHPPRLQDQDDAGICTLIWNLELGKR